MISLYDPTAVYQEMCIKRQLAHEALQFLMGGHHQQQGGTEDQQSWVDIGVSCSGLPRADRFR